jgi:hypothetical protein
MVIYAADAAVCAVLCRDLPSPVDELNEVNRVLMHYRARFTAWSSQVGPRIGLATAALTAAHCWHRNRPNVFKQSPTGRRARTDRFRHKFDMSYTPRNDNGVRSHRLTGRSHWASAQICKYEKTAVDAEQTSATFA